MRSFLVKPNTNINMHELSTEIVIIVSDWITPLPNSNLAYKGKQTDVLTTRRTGIITDLKYIEIEKPVSLETIYTRIKVRTKAAAIET